MKDPDIEILTAGDGTAPPYCDSTPAEEPQQHPSSMLGNKTIEDVIDREAREEQQTQFSIARTLGGVIVARFVRKQLGLVLLITLFLIWHINNRYQCQQKLVEIDRTERAIKKARYKATVTTSRLTELSRESNILNLLAQYGDSTLNIPTVPPYLIKVPQ